MRSHKRKKNIKECVEESSELNERESIITMFIHFMREVSPNSQKVFRIHVLKTHLANYHKVTFSFGVVLVEVGCFELKFTIPLNLRDRSKRRHLAFSLRLSKVKFFKSFGLSSKAL